MKNLIFIIVSILMFINCGYVRGQDDQERMERLEQNIETLKFKIDTLRTGIDSFLVRSLSDQERIERFEHNVDTIKLKVDTLETGLDSIINLITVKEDIFYGSIGGRYSFIAEKKPISLYYDIVGFIPSIFKDSTKKYPNWINRIGVYTSIHETYFKADVSKPDVGDNNSSSRFYPDKYTFVKYINDDSALVARNSFYRSLNTTSENHLSLSICPTFKIHDYLYAFFHAEYIYSRSNLKVNDTLVATDTISVLRGSYSTLFCQYDLCKKYQEHHYSTLFGGGLFLNYKHKNLLFQYRFGIGSINTRYYLVANDRKTSPSSDTEFYWSSHFALIERKSGIKIGGEIISIPDNNELNYLIYFALQFPLSKFSDKLGLN